jgi:NADPH:quinone reductase-like Zn-dependent oxidoreductase
MQTFTYDSGVEIQSQGKAAVYEEPLGPAGVRIRTRPITDPAPGMVSVRVRAAALNHLDIWLAHGAQRVQPPRVICADGAGVVEHADGDRVKAGDEVVVYPVTADWDCAQCRAGQAVFCPHFGILGEHTDGTACELLQVPAQNVYPKPAGLSFEEAAAFPLTFLTAWRMLTTRAALTAGETLLVVGAGAGVATAGLLIGKHLGARVLATSRSEEKRRRARELGAEAAFESSGFAKAVQEATGGRGADVVFEHVGAATLDESLKSLAPGGRIAICGATSGVKAEINLPRLFFKHASLLGSTMGNPGEFEAILGAIESGLRPVVDRVFPLDDVQAALEHLDRAEQFGKVVLRIG